MALTALLLPAALVVASTNDAPPRDLPASPTHLRRQPVAPGSTVPEAHATLVGVGAGRDGTRVRVPSLPAAGVPLGTPPSANAGCSPFSNGTFFNDLYAWSASSSAASPPVGTVTVQSGVAVFAEGNSFLTTLSQPFCVPAGAVELRFDLVSTGFDATAGFIPDAFEVSLLDASSQSVVPTWASGATSFFNVQEDGTQLFGPNVTVTGSTVALDLTGVAAGEPVLLTFDLIGADADAAGTVSIDEVIVDDGGPGVLYCEGVVCPCGNDSPGTGCLNSFGRGGLLVATGTASVTADDLVLEASGMTPSFALLFGGTVQTCVPTGDGLIGLRPGVLPIDLLRLGVQQASADGRATYGPGIVALVDQAAGAAGTVVAGSTWSFQLAYRDAPVSPCSTFFNYTNPVRVTFTN